MQQLAASLELPEADLFGDAAERGERAYDLHAARMGYVKKGAGGE